MILRLTTVHGDARSALECGGLTPPCSFEIHTAQRAKQGRSASQEPSMNLGRKAASSRRTPRCLRHNHSHGRWGRPSARPGPSALAQCLLCPTWVVLLSYSSLRGLATPLLMRPPVYGAGVIWDWTHSEAPVIPAKAGIQFADRAFHWGAEWIPAFAGMTAALSPRISQMKLAPGVPCYCIPSRSGVCYRAVEN
jgi:hypothetical protein